MTIDDIQQKLKQESLDAYIIGYENRFLGQDILPQEHKIKYLCGFSGSAGMLAVTADKVFLFVDGRYELQARQEVDTNKISVVNQTPCLENVLCFLKQQKVQKIGFDGWSVAAGEIAENESLFPKLQLVDVGTWVDLEAKSIVEVKERSSVYAGASRQDKLRLLIDIMQAGGADYYLITAADSVSWLLNIYAKDLQCSPVVRAYALIDKNGEVKLIADNLQTDLPVCTFGEFENWLKTQTAKILYTAASIPSRLKKILKNGVPVQDICQLQKAEKNETELQGMINCHQRDGVALVKLLYWLQNNWRGKTELEVVQKLHELRQEQDLFFEESFETIAGAAENGAIVHYQPTEKTNRKLQENNLLLLDSGGQYFDGTTDVTRTVALGIPSAEMIHDFTLVLKGHIALERAIFPKETSGVQLDALARLPLWREGKDYKHGTGHGVGCFGNVHEGPNRISNKGSMYGFKANMVTSIEPGYYKENAYGIRIENLVYSKPSKKYENFLEFETLTLVPIDKKLIDVYLLDAGEQDWLNNYHRKVYESLAACVNDDEKKWLKESCSPL
mgnify:FL=1